MRPAGPPPALGPAFALLAIACAPIATAGPGCVPVASAAVLPDELQEASGAGVSLRDPEIVWTHSDQGASLFALDRSGRVVGEHLLPLRLRDWEDLEVAGCAESGSCIYLAD
ncbi:MAG TPA: hypothetical protein VLA09_10950, partial [Longimicrobiales bacterium]|nr:hypothetical protein [Longimicrobiales bacterium]